jgi:hypothetical protein
VSQASKPPVPTPLSYLKSTILQIKSFLKVNKTTVEHQPQVQGLSKHVFFCHCTDYITVKMVLVEELWKANAKSG